MRDFFFFCFFAAYLLPLTNPAEIEQLFRAHFEQLHRYAFTLLKSTEEAKDIVQAVFLNLWEKREALQINTSPRAYLFRSVYNECLNHIQKQATRNKHHQAAGYTGTYAETSVFREEEELLTRERINKALEGLPPQCREVFVKSRAEQKKYTEIAAEMGIAVKTVEAHMSKALKLIRQIIRVFIWIVCLFHDQL